MRSKNKYPERLQAAIEQRIGDKNSQVSVALTTSLQTLQTYVNSVPGKDIPTSPVFLDQLAGNKTRVQRHISNLVAAATSAAYWNDVLSDLPQLRAQYLSSSAIGVMDGILTADLNNVDLVHALRTVFSLPLFDENKDHVACCTGNSMTQEHVQKCMRRLDMIGRHNAVVEEVSRLLFAVGIGHHAELSVNGDPRSASSGHYN